MVRSLTVMHFRVRGLRFRWGPLRRTHRGLAALVLAFVVGATTLAPAPAEAVSGSRLVGHRCRTYSAAVTNEDTVSALVDTSGVAGAWCEIDVTRLADGTLIVWHDPTWSRVADASTLPAGVRATDPVRNATWAQVDQIRTKGGARVATFARMIDAAGVNGVNLLVEVRADAIRNPGFWVDYAAAANAHVEYYQPVSATCTTVQLNELRA